MKISKFLVIGLVFLTIPSLVFSALTADLALTGTVAASTSIALNQTSASLTMTDNTYSDVNVAVVTERSNVRVGYTVTVSSLNGVARSAASGILQIDGTSDTIPYTVKYGVLGSEASITLANGAGTLTNVNTRSSGPVAKNFLISYSIDTGLLEAGIYTDTLTFTITTK